MTQIVQFDFNDLQALVKDCLREVVNEVREIPKPVELPKRMTFKDACAYADMSESKMYKLCMGQNAPCHKYNGRWIFYRDELDNWIKERTIPASEVMSRKLASTARKKLQS